MATEKQFQVKVIYQKPSFAQKQSLHKNGLSQGSEGGLLEQNNEENDGLLSNQISKNPFPQLRLNLNQDFIKLNAVSDQNKVSELKHRPKSATTQQLKKNQVTRTKLGPNNTNIKPQISYVSKISLKQRPGSALPGTSIPNKSLDKLKIKTKEAIVVEQPMSPAKEDVNIPFTQNRYQGQFSNITKDLFKKAKEVVKEEKLNVEKMKQEAILKKEKEKQQQEEVRKKNQELVQIQKEKGIEHKDFRQLEEQKKQQLRMKENKQERDKRVEARQKRKEEGRKPLGLDIFDTELLEDKIKKIKEQQLLQQQQEQKTESTLKRPILESQIKQRPQSAVPLGFNNKHLKEMILEEQKLQQQEEEKQIDKKQLLKEQKLKRKQDILEKQRQEDLEKQKKTQNIINLEEKFRQQKSDYIRKKEFQQKVREEQERLKKLMEESNDNKGGKNHRKKKSKTEEEMTQEKRAELKDWIESQMQKEDLIGSAADLDYDQGDDQRVNPLIKVQIDKKVKVNQNQQQQEQQQVDEVENSINQLKMAKHLLPGNHLLAEKQESSLGPRQNRYGVNGDNGYGEIVEIKRQKILNQDVKKVEQPGQEKQQNQKLTIKEKKKIKEHMQEKIIEMSKQMGIDIIPNKNANNINNNSDQKQEDQDNSQEIVNIDKEMVEQIFRKIIIDKRDHSQSKSNKKSSKKQQNNVDKIMPPPGILNIEKTIQREKKEQQDKELKALVVIQQWTKGYLARQFVHKLREIKRGYIEQEYGYFKDQVKFNNDFNLEKFLREKKKMREKNKINSYGGASSDNIQEKIGVVENSASFSNNRIMNGEPNQLKMTNQNNNPNTVKVANYFQECPGERDPLSLISIFAKRHIPRVASPKQQLSQKKTSSRLHILGSGASSDNIDEEIYSEDGFDDEHRSDAAAAGVKRIVTTQEDIDEDIILEGSRGQSSYGSNKNLLVVPNTSKGGKQQNMKQMPFNYKLQTANQQQSIGAGDSIQESIMGASIGGGKRSKMSPGGAADQSSIGEDSYLQYEQSQSKVSVRKQNLYEESIKEELAASQNYDNEGFDSYNGSNAKPARQQQQQTKDQQKIKKEIEQKYQESNEQRKTHLNEMLEEIKKYEQASVSTLVVERMEKIINLSLHQKDKLVLASRLHELEMEKQHKDEINKVREEQIKLMTQLMLMGNQSSMNEEDKKKVLESITQIIDKPVTIIHQQQLLYPQQQVGANLTNTAVIVGASDSDNTYEEQDEMDYIEESRQLQMKDLKNKNQKGYNAKNQDDSIAESLPPAADDEDQIEESIPENIDSENESRQSDAGEIKESVYVEGKKLKDKKDNRSNSNNVGNDLKNMRIALGSESTIREQSKKILKGDHNNNINNNSSNHNNNDDKYNSVGLFEKNSFQNFTNQKFKELLFDDKFAQQYLENYEQKIMETEQQEKQKLKKDLTKNLISPRTFSRKEKELEKWVVDERKELRSNKLKVETFKEMGPFLNKLENDKKQMLEKIGSPRINKRLLDSNNSQSSLIGQDYDDIEEESNESVRVRQARNQISFIGKEMGKHQGQDKQLDKKKIMAKKLMEEKERAIQEGIKERLRDLDQEHADQLLNKALNLDVEREVQRRINQARRQIEDSNQSELDHYDSVRSATGPLNDDLHKKKNKVHFASPEQNQYHHGLSSSVQSNMGESSIQSSKQLHPYNSSNQKLNRITDSIDESIKVEEQSFQSIQESRNTLQMERSKGEQLSQSAAIQESIREEESSQYSEDFVQMSNVSKKVGRDKGAAQFASQQRSLDRYSSSGGIQSNHIKVQDSIDGGDDIDYSMNFEEQSLGHSQQMQPHQNQQKQADKEQISVVDEESEGGDQEGSNFNKSQGSKKMSSNNNDHFVEEEEINEQSQSLQASSKINQSSSQNNKNFPSAPTYQQEQNADISQNDDSSYDQEIVQSSLSIDWKINLIKQQQQQQQEEYEDQEEEKYSENFDDAYDDVDQSDNLENSQKQQVQQNQLQTEEREDEDEDIDNLEDLESCPEEIDQSQNTNNNTDNIDLQVDRITNEFMDIFLNGIGDDITNIKAFSKLLPDLEQFQNKFPFNLIQKVEPIIPTPKKEEQKQQQDVINVIIGSKNVPQKSVEEQQREHYESVQKQVQETFKQVELYLDLIIKNIDRRELIYQLEKPIENDPLKVLARIQAAEYDDQQSSYNNINESILGGQSQFILSLDYFKLVENLFRAKQGSNNDNRSLTESGEQRKFTFENFHHKAIFDAFNEALDNERPYKMKGEPNPWSKQTRQLRPKISGDQAEKIILKARDKVIAWTKSGAGTKCAPVPNHSSNQNEYDAPQQQLQQHSEEERRNQLREEKLGELLTKEIEEGDQCWVDYENEDTQTKFDLADMILSDLASEIAEFLNSKLNRL